jgi:hypothetical protein
VFQDGRLDQLGGGQVFEGGTKDGLGLPCSPGSRVAAAGIDVVAEGHHVGSSSRVGLRWYQVISNGI